MVRALVQSDMMSGIVYRRLFPTCSATVLQVFVTTTHLAIVMEYAGGGELFNRVAAPPRHHLTESEARTFFRELLAGVEYCHSVVRIILWIGDSPRPASVEKALSGRALGSQSASLDEPRQQTGCNQWHGCAGRVPSGPEAGEHPIGRLQPAAH